MFNIDVKTCTLDELNRELKRFASRKCRAKDEKSRLDAEKSYRELVDIKNSRFQTTKKSYFTMSDNEIQELDLETTIKGIASLRSRMCVYKSKKTETLEVLKKFTDHKTELQERQKLVELMTKYNK